MTQQMSGDKRNIDELLVEIDSMRHQIEHLRNGNQLALLAKERREAEMDALKNIGQAATVETNLSELLMIIYREIIKILGGLDLILALFNQDQNLIEFPYAIENGELTNLVSIPFEENLISTLLKEQRPLILSKDNNSFEQRPALDNQRTKVKSWMGVPLTIGDETIGALIIQDLSKENRFNHHDQQIMLAVANQIAANIRYIRMIESVRQKAENELLIAEISRKISASTSVESVLRTAIKELGQYFRASNTQILLDISSEPSSKKMNGAG